VAYPNPVTGTQVNISSPANFPYGSLKIQIYTVAMKAVRSLTLSNVHPGTTVTLPLLDQAGVILSNGLYYIQLTTSNGQRSVIKLLVLR
jgi:hypothetical protein